VPIIIKHLILYSTDYKSALAKEPINISDGKYTWSEKKEGSATYARLFKEIPESIELKL
jgi:hypothetical protein